MITPEDKATAARQLDELDDLVARTVTAMKDPDIPRDLLLKGIDTLGFGLTQATAAMRCLLSDA